MSIRDEARQEAERRWPSPNSGLYEGLIIGFRLGAVWASERAEVEAQRVDLAAEIHEAWEFQYDECDHGTYRGGHLSGEPYAMCEITASRIVRRRADDLRAVVRIARGETNEREGNESA